MHFFAKLQKKSGAIILMYHSVAEKPEAQFIDPRDHVPPDIFEKQMEFLSRQRKVISLQELLDMLRLGETPKAGSVVITFDDGYLDNLTVAAPILDRLRLTATIFLPTGYIDRGENQWVDQVFTAFKFRTSDELIWDHGQKYKYNLINPKECNLAYQTLCSHFLCTNAEKRRSLLKMLLNQLLPSARPPRLTMTWEDIQTLQANHQCFLIGCHTAEHIDLTSVSHHEALRELTSCAKWVEEKLGIQAQHFCFPYGRTSKQLRLLVAKAGFNSACGSDDYDPVINSRTNPFKLPRIEAPPSMSRFDILTETANSGFWRRMGS